MFSTQLSILWETFTQEPLHKETEYAGANLIAHNAQRSQGVNKCAFLHDDPRHPQPDRSAEQLLVFYFVFAHCGPEYLCISTALPKNWMFTILWWFMMDDWPTQISEPTAHHSANDACNSRCTRHTRKPNAKHTYTPQRTKAAKMLRGGSRYVEGCWESLYLKIKKCKV